MIPIIHVHRRHHQVTDNLHYCPSPSFDFHKKIDIINIKNRLAGKAYNYINLPNTRSSSGVTGHSVEYTQHYY